MEIEKAIYPSILMFRSTFPTMLDVFDLRLNAKLSHEYHVWLFSYKYMRGKEKNEVVEKAFNKLNKKDRSYSIIQCLYKDFNMISEINITICS